MSDRISNLKTFIWHYKKVARKQLFLNVFLLFFSVIIFIGQLNPICLCVIYLTTYYLNRNNVPNLSNSVLAGTPIRIKGTVYLNTFLLWIQATAIIVLGIIVSIFSCKYDVHTVVNIIEYIFFAYSFLNLAFVLDYSIPKPYRNLTFYVLVAIFGSFFFFLSTLDFLLKLFLFLILITVVLIISKKILENLSFEKILRNEER